MRLLEIRSSAKELLDFVTRTVALRPFPAKLLSLYYSDAQSGWSKFSKQRRMNVCVIRSKAIGYMEGPEPRRQTFRFHETNSYVAGLYRVTFCARKVSQKLGIYYYQQNRLKKRKLPDGL
ncbi:hypothetical protein I7I51_07159 [Histoplasma capsulatum]|uniref:Uncharacterized protein n=1 Tax=Ajellomyces capsulatus TaxID=5037 RepID=A0A8A1MNT6_AJECA|nr:hypothetical protein I7I51_07159 [Histoplasma capsulatum]